MTKELGVQEPIVQSLAPSTLSLIALMVAPPPV